MIHHESEEQQALFTWAEYEKHNIPELELLYHIPNGGKRNAREAARLKREGVKSGVPDINLPIPRGMYYGLWVEMKSEKGKPTKSQEKWIKSLRDWGHYVAVCHNWEEAKNEIIKYLCMDKTC